MAEPAPGARQRRKQEGYSYTHCTAVPTPTGTAGLLTMSWRGADNPNLSLRSSFDDTACLARDRTSGHRRVRTVRRVRYSAGSQRCASTAAERESRSGGARLYRLVPETRERKVQL